MPYLFTSGIAVVGPPAGFEGHVYYQFPGTAVRTEATLPTGVQGMDIQPIITQYRKRSYIFGQFSENLVFNEHVQLHRMGMRAPTTIPTLAAGTGSGGSTGDATCYITHRHKVGPYLIHESNPGGATNTVSLTGQGRAWSGLPTTALDSRVTHLAGYVSMDGATARFAWERELGTATVEENVSTAALGEVINTNRGVPPYSHSGEPYHDRMFFAPTNFPTRLYYSEIGEPESVQATSYFETLDGEFITAIKKHYSQLLVFCRRSTYSLTGYTASDFQFHKIHPGIGCIARKSVLDINGNIWFASEDGVYVYDGSFTFCMKNLFDYWRDEYLDNQAAYERSEAGDDRYGHKYKLLIRKTVSPKSFYYVGQYEDFDPSLGGGNAQPDWTFDIRAREDRALGLLADANSRRDQFYVGSCDSYIRKENVESNSDDDGDSYAKAATVQFRHDYFDKIGGQEGLGKTVESLDLYVKSENQAFVAQCYSGEDDAPNASTPTAGPYSFAATALSGSVAKTRHHFNPDAVGEGLTVKITASAPVGLEIAGYGGEWTEGPSNRGAS